MAQRELGDAALAKETLETARTPFAVGCSAVLLRDHSDIADSGQDECQCSSLSLAQGERT